MTRAFRIVSQHFVNNLVLWTIVCLGAVFGTYLPCLYFSHDYN